MKLKQTKATTVAKNDRSIERDRHSVSVGPVYLPTPDRRPMMDEAASSFQPFRPSCPLSPCVIIPIFKNRCKIRENPNDFSKIKEIKPIKALFYSLGSGPQIANRNIPSAFHLQPFESDNKGHVIFKKIAPRQPSPSESNYPHETSKIHYNHANESLFPKRVSGSSPENNLSLVREAARRDVRRLG